MQRQGATKCPGISEQLPVSQLCVVRGWKWLLSGKGDEKNEAAMVG